MSGRVTVAHLQAGCVVLAHAGDHATGGRGWLRRLPGTSAEVAETRIRQFVANVLTSTT